MKPTLLFLTTLILASCASKQLDVHKSRTAVRKAEDLSLHSLQSSSYQGNRLTLTSDSNNRIYQVNIFPNDTFSFSTQNGFKGKAFKVEIVGREDLIKKISDSISFSAKRENEIQFDHESQSRETIVSRDRSLEKKKSSIVIYVIGIGILCLAIALFRKIWQNKTW